MSFLTANWNNLVLINYAIDPDILNPYIPKRTELDFYQGICYVSLVGFLFSNTKLLGLPIPFHRNFEEVNLRFYVKRKEGFKWKRGVVFIKELVPKPALTLVANTVYKEHYQTVPMKHEIKETNASFSFNYSWKMKNKWQYIDVETVKELTPILPQTEEDFICEHYFGYTKYKDQTFEYEVKHPKWQQLNVLNNNIEVDFKLNYGNDFELLNHQKPRSVILARGSKIAVENKFIIN